jgi:hypothetical protein
METPSAPRNAPSCMSKNEIPQHWELEQLVEQTYTDLGGMWKLTLTNGELEETKHTSTLAGIISDINPTGSSGEHLFYINPLASKFTNLDMYNISKSILAETDLIFGHNPYFYDRESLAADNELLNKTILLCERTSMVWAMDNLFNMYPDEAKELLFRLVTNGIKSIEKLFDTGFIFDADTLGIFFDAKINMDLLRHRYKYTNCELVNKEIDLILRDIPEISSAVRRISQIYTYMPKMPHDRKQAIAILEKNTSFHFDLSVGTQIENSILTTPIMITDNINNNYFHGWRWLINQRGKHLLHFN